MGQYIPGMKPLCAVRFPIKVILRREDDLLNLMKSESGQFVTIPKTQTVVVLKINNRNVKL